MATDGPDDELLLEAYAIIDTTPEMDETIAKLRDLLAVDHVNPHMRIAVVEVADRTPQCGHEVRWPKVSHLHHEEDGLCHQRPTAAYHTSKNAPVQGSRCGEAEIKNPKRGFRYGSKTGSDSPSAGCLLCPGRPEVSGARSE
jgi:hypothetical protein